MKVGLSLPVTYLTGEISNSADQFWFDMFGEAKEALKSIKKMGAASIEINKVNGKTSFATIKQAFELVENAGFSATMHGWLPTDAAELPANLVELIRFLKGRDQGSLAVATHAHEFYDWDKRSEAVEKTLIDLKLLKEQLEKEESALGVALEVCRIKEQGPVGTTYDEVYEMADSVGFSPNLGICWDVGHTQANFNLGKDVAYPDLKFAQKVIHTHIHDIGPDGRTHGPVLKVDDYLGDCLRILHNAGYDRVYNLELYPPRWGMSASECKQGVADSIQTVKEIISKESGR